MEQYQESLKKTTAYYLIMATIVVFIFSEFITRGPVQPFAAAVDDMKIKYVFMGFASLMFLILIVTRRKKLFKNSVFLFESKLFLGAILGLVVITIYYQIRNGFRSFVIPEFFYILFPLLFVILIVSVDYYNITRILDNCFYVVIIAFIIGNIDILSVSSIFSISFSDSASSPFENGSSIVFVCFELYFLIRYQRRNTKSLVCLVLTILTFKRLAIVKAILFFIFVPIIKNKKVSRWILITVIVMFCLLPLLLEYIYSNNFANIMLAKYGIEMNELTMDRFKRTVYVLGHMGQIKYGYGSVTYFLTNNYGLHEFSNRSLHSDILRIYLECSFVGTLIYNSCYFLAVKKNVISFILMLHIFTEMIVNHPLGAGNVGNWTIFYLMIVYFNYREVVPFYKEGRIGKKKIKLGKIVI